jgi:hypothetical protein
MEEEPRKRVKIIKKSKLTPHEIQGIKELVNYTDSTVINVVEFPKCLKIHYLQKPQKQVPVFPLGGVLDPGQDIQTFLDNLNNNLKRIASSPRGFGKTTKHNQMLEMKKKGYIK